MKKIYIFECSLKNRYSIYDVYLNNFIKSKTIKNF